MKIGITQETDWDSIYKVLETAFLDEENKVIMNLAQELSNDCLLYTSPSPRDRTRSRMPSSA